jgi:arsenate reductase (glutaredoxin)
VELTFYGYDNCGTCRKAKKWLKEHGIEFHSVPIIESPPTKVELEKFLRQSGLPLKKFFNTSGKRYRDLGMKDKLASSSEDELLNWLASDGRLIKRPIVTDNESVTVGFDEETFEKVWGNNKH